MELNRVQQFQFFQILLKESAVSDDCVYSLQKILAYVAYDMDETRTTAIELEYNYGKTEYKMGTGYAQVRHL